MTSTFFSEQQIEDLQDIAWWEWPDEKIKAELPHMANLSDFLDRWRGK